MKEILAIDYGTHTGWARRRADGTVESGVCSFEPETGDVPGDRWMRFSDWLDEEVTRWVGRVDCIIVERWVHGIGTGAKVTAGFLTLIEKECAECDIPLVEVSPAELKRWLTGSGNASKEAMVAAVRNRGWSTKKDLSHDEADALALLWFAQKT